jgi:hypothetical protein
LQVREAAGSGVLAGAGAVAAAAGAAAVGFESGAFFKAAESTGVANLVVEHPARVIAMNITIRFIAPLGNG